MDAVDHPSHYKRHASSILIKIRGELITDTDMVEMECYDAMLNRFTTVEQIRGYLIGNIFKYQWRYQDKGGVQDIRKAQWYEGKLITLEEIMESNHAK